ncbi:MAG: hypothetical protein EZS28_012338 [Streblomastix strix]|uniref:Uncharacterized protein n=1 Tax=Streblomastix strix TaxID=222440 RepID=A0A5J4WBU5_9EUKA|nr:MAG: hypothetical protein EZS28_012338 [Streblomastix strix]
MALTVRVPEAVMMSDASIKNNEVILELLTRDTLVQQGEWNREQKHWTSNNKEMEAIYLGLFRYGKLFREQQIKAILIKLDSSIAIQDLSKQRAEQTLVAEVKKIVKLCQQLRIQTQIQQIPGISNKVTDALMPCVIDNTNSGLIRYKGKQARGQIHGNRRGRARGRMVKRIFQTLEGEHPLDPPTNSEDWKSPDRLGGKMQICTRVFC